jgi:hypothetical protein
VPVVFRHHRQARRLIIRLDREGTGVVVTLPLRVSRDAGLAFATKSTTWIAARLARQQEGTPFVAGAEIPVRGAMLRIDHHPDARGTVWHDLNQGKLCVAGRPEHISRRISDWLKAEARRDLVAASVKYAGAMGVKFHRIAIRDQRSRWGSCASDGSLAYSWRLIMAPPHVLDYVAAHEVAHLRHMNHSVKFWRLVLGHCPHSAAAKAWLKTNGNTLHRYRH